jgi:CRP-like cAMP-binding protein
MADVLLHFVQPDVSLPWWKLQLPTAYLRRWFAPDVLTALPVDLIVRYFVDPSHSNFNDTLVRLVFLLSRLLRLLRVGRLLGRLQQNPSLSYGLVKMLSLQGGIFGCIHICACFWLLLIRLQDYPEDGWYPSWLKLQGVSSYSQGDQYITALYWSVATIMSVGYGDVVPKTSVEMLFADLCMCLGSFLFSYIIGHVPFIRATFVTRGTLYESKVRETLEYCERNAVTEELRHRVRNYYESTLDERHFVDEQVLLDAMPKSLKATVLLNMNNEAVRKIPLFAAMGERFLMNLASLLQPFVCAAGDFIIHEGEVGREMFILIRGTVIIMVGDRPVRQLSNGSFFGEIALLENAVRNASVIAETTSDMFSLGQTEFVRLLDDSEGAREKFEEIAVWRAKAAAAAAGQSADGEEDDSDADSECSGVSAASEASQSQFDASGIELKPTASSGTPFNVKKSKLKPSVSGHIPSPYSASEKVLAPLPSKHAQGGHSPLPGRAHGGHSPSGAPAGR